jgi:hypothetical protein
MVGGSRREVGVLEEGVGMQREAEFRSEEPGVMIRADLYTPDDGEGPWPVVIMDGGWCYVKELRDECGARNSLH